MVLAGSNTLLGTRFLCDAWTGIKQSVAAVYHRPNAHPYDQTSRLYETNDIAKQPTAMASIWHSAAKILENCKWQ